MKFLAFILSFLVISLSVLPCADEILAGSAEKNKLEVTGQHNQQDDCEQEDACSPFCHCTCCASFSVSSIFTGTSSSIVDDMTSYCSYLPVILPDHSYPVWQPPKIG